MTVRWPGREQLERVDWLSADRPVARKSPIILLNQGVNSEIKLTSLGVYRVLVHPIFIFAIEIIKTINYGNNKDHRLQSQ